MPFSTALIRKITEVEPPLREVLLSILEEMEKQRAQWEESVTKTEFNELKEIVRDLGKTVAELAEAQKRTEEEIAKLARGLQRVRKEVGGLSRTMAYALENEAYRHLPAFLKAHYQLEIIDRLVRTYLDGEEINIFGRARKNGQEVYLVGEAVLKLDDAAKLKQVWKKVQAVKEEFGKEVVPIIVTHFAKPEILERARKAGAIVVQSFEWV